MAPANRLSYLAFPARRGFEKVLFNVAVSAFQIAFGIIGVAVVVGGVVAGSAAPVIFGILWSAGFGFIVWTGFHQASRLEFTDGCLSWRGSLPWSPWMRPGRVKAIRWPASPRSRYVRIELDDGRKLSALPRRGLMEFINSVQEAEPAIVVDVRLSGRAMKRTGAEPPGYIQQRVRAAGNNVASGSPSRLRVRWCCWACWPR